ncbi:MAG: hypothetical protein PUG89_00395 [Succinivibrio sp.]|nr:hypothetical protein [Succinivibrio sp.]
MTKINKRTAVKNFFREKVKITILDSEKIIYLHKQKNIKRMTPAEEWKKMYLEANAKVERLEGQLEDLQNRYDTELLKSAQLRLINQELYAKTKD